MSGAAAELSSAAPRLRAMPRSKEKERAAAAEHRRPLLDGGPEGFWVPLGPMVEPEPPPPHGKLLLVSLTLKREAEAVGVGATQALGFHTAAVTTATVPGTLTAIIQRAAAMQNDLEVLEHIREKGSALHTELQSVKAWLRSAEETPKDHPGT